MLQRLVHLFGLAKKDDVLAKRFAQLTARYATTCRQDNADFVTQIRSGLDRQPVVGSCNLQRDSIKQHFLESYVRSTEVGQEGQLIGAGRN